MINKIKISLLQIQSKDNPFENSLMIKNILNKIIKFNPHIVCLPECSNIMTGNRIHLFKNVTYEENCPVLDECKKFSKKNKISISIGSLLLRKKNSKKLLNRSFFIDNNGKIISYYDKIHLFDVNINKKEIHRESSSFNKGTKIVYANSSFGKIGLSICYDIRFPNLFAKLTKMGVKIILVPAAFTRPTGKDHWEVLLRSRAIENTCFIIASAQCGKHHGGRKTYGHSMIVNPWGKIIIKGNSEPAILNATINMNDIKKIRQKMPSIKHSNL